MANLSTLTTPLMRPGHPVNAEQPGGEIASEQKKTFIDKVQLFFGSDRWLVCPTAIFALLATFLGLVLAQDPNLWYHHYYAGLNWYDPSRY